MAIYPIGVDVSKYNAKFDGYGNYTGWNPDNAKKPINFVIQRASWSMYKDEQFDAVYKQVIKVPIRGAYHYYSSGVPWKMQADLFLSVVKDKGFHFYVVDYETAFNNLTGRTIAEAAEFVKYVKQITGKKCLFYYSPSVYNQYIKPFNYDYWATQQDTWIAQYPYTTTEEITQTQPSLPNGITQWVIWQYGGGDVNYTAGRHAGANYGGGTDGIDLNYYHGSTIEEMKNFFGIADGEVTPPTPVIPPVADSNTAIVMVQSLNVRGGPGTTFPIVRTLSYGSKIVILEYSKQGPNVWGRYIDGWIALLYNNYYYTDKRVFPASNVESPTIPATSNLYVFSQEAYWKRPGNGPLVTPIYTMTKTSSTKEILLGQEWMDYFKKINSQSTVAYQRIVAPDWGPSKGINSNGKLIYNTLVYPGRNIVKITDITIGVDGQKWGKVDAWDVSNGTPTPDINYIDTPHLVHSVYGSGSDYKWFYLTNSPRVVVLQNASPKYIEMKWLIPVSSLLPKTVNFKNTMNIRQAPLSTSSVVGTAFAGAPIQITAVTISKGGIWGQCSQGWIALRYNDVTMSNWEI